MEFDHELRLWLKSKKSRKTHLDTRVEAAQSDREIARSRAPSMAQVEKEQEDSPRYSRGSSAER